MLVLASGQAAPAAHAQALDIDSPDFAAGEREMKSVNVFNRRGIDAARSSHEISAAYAPLDWLKLAAHFDVEHILSGDWQADHGALELQLKLLEAGAEGGLSIGWFSSVQVSTHGDTTNSLVFGPIAKLEAGAAALTVNTYLVDTFGRNREPGLALQYGWQARAELGGGIAVGIEGFGTLDDIGDAGPVELQDHRIGPSFYATHPLALPGQVIAIETALLFGLTEAAPTTALKISAALNF